MVRSTVERRGAALIAFSLAFLGFGFNFSHSATAQAEEPTIQRASLEIDFDFKTLPTERPSFRDMVRVYQWSSDKTIKKDQSISKDTHKISLTPLGNDNTINFYVYVGKDQGYAPEIFTRDLYSFSGTKAKTAELSDIHVGRTLNISFANLMDSKETLPTVPTDASLYEPLFLEDTAKPDSFTSVEQGASELVLPRVMFNDQNAFLMSTLPSGDFTLRLSSNTFHAEVINSGYLRLGPIDVDAELGKHKIKVLVNYADGSFEYTSASFNITEKKSPELKSQLWKLSYADTTVQQLKSATVDLTATLFGKERALPRAVTFAKGADMPRWANVDTKTGTITLNPDEYVELKDYVFHVVVTHLDGKTEKVAVKIKVTEADPETTYPLTPLKPGKHTIPALELTPAQPIAKPHTPKPVETPSTGLAKTGVDLAGLAGLALISALAGATVLRRRHAE
ncbi:Rib/alpha-like domain-containing protein [Arcanobacterium phocae]|uniref:Rib/alpha-like domain-containing protein n=1 Tax=Arcanobacterium phocae TaxID=131112 RepID=UPI001C1103B7|nr:Rib/alpha-like domain-containing protein [Arcanobacterium phocae]